MWPGVVKKVKERRRGRVQGLWPALSAVKSRLEMSAGFLRWEAMAKRGFGDFLGCARWPFDDGEVKTTADKIRVMVGAVRGKGATVIFSTVAHARRLHCTASKQSSR